MGLPLALGHDMVNNEEVEEPQMKRIKLEEHGGIGGLKSFTDEVEYLADRLRTTWNKHYYS